MIPNDEVAAVEQLQTKYAELKKEISKVIVGQEEVVDNSFFLYFVARTVF